MRPQHLRDRDLHLRGDPMRTRHRPMRPIRQPRQALGQIPGHPPKQGGSLHADIGRDLVQRDIAQDGPHRVQALLDDRQDNQCQSRPSPVQDAPRRRHGSRCRGRRPRRTSPGVSMSHITWHNTHAVTPRIAGLCGRQARRSISVVSVLVSAARVRRCSCSPGKPRAQRRIQVTHDREPQLDDWKAD